MQSWHDAQTYQQNNLESKSGVLLTLCISLNG